MKALVGLASMEAAPEGAAVTIGTFDGVHVGHRALIARTRAEAGERGMRSIVITWDRHPSATLRPERVPPLLTSPERKAELVEAAGIDALVVLPFDRDLSRWPPARFAGRVLVEGLAATRVFVGEGWRFGHRAAGDVALLLELGAKLGFEAEAVPLAAAAGGPVSSSRARQAVAAGDMELARVLLGRHFDLDAVVVPGAGRGASLGYPTANLDFDRALARPGRGVYAGRVRVHGVWYPAAVNVGVNPQFGGDPEHTPVRIEAYLLGFEGDLYGRSVRIEFLRRLRDERKFDAVGDLIAQMGADVEETKAVSRSAAPC